MQPVSLAYNQNEYRVNPIRSNESRMPRRERAYVENYGQDGESLGKAYQQAVLIANMKDEQLLSLAKADANKDKKYKLGTYTAALVGVPVVDTFVSGALSEAPKLSGKLGTMGKVAAGWGGAFMLAGLYNGFVDKVSAVSPVVKNFEEKHPVIASLLSLAGFAAVLVGAHKGIGKASEVFVNKFPKIAESMSNLKSSVADTINNSKFNEKIVQPAKTKIVELAQKYPKTARITIGAAVLSVPFMVMGTLFKLFTEKYEKAEQVKDTYKKLAEAREINRVVLNKINNGIVDEPIVNLANLEAERELDEAKQDIENAECEVEEDEYDSDNGHFD